MTLLRDRAARVLRAVFAAAALPLAAGAQGFSLPINLQLGIPQGEFAQNVNLAGGFGAGGIIAMNQWFGIRGQLDVQIYGAERRRVPLGGGALGLINVDVTTTNAIVGGALGVQVGMPGPSIRPYAGAMLGFSAFTTSSQVSGSNSTNEPFASSTNSLDNAFAKILYGGIYIPIGAGGSSFDIGVRHTWNGESVRYLTPGDLVEDGNGDIIITPNNTRADLLTITLGVTLRPGRTEK